MSQSNQDGLESILYLLLSTGIAIGEENPSTHKTTGSEALKETAQLLNQWANGRVVAELEASLYEDNLDEPAYNDIADRIKQLKEGNKVDE